MFMMYFVSESQYIYGRIAILFVVILIDYSYYLEYTTFLGFNINLRETLEIFIFLSEFIVSLFFYKLTPILIIFQIFTTHFIKLAFKHQTFCITKYIRKNHVVLMSYDNSHDTKIPSQIRRCGITFVINELRFSGKFELNIIESMYIDKFENYIIRKNNSLTFEENSQIETIELSFIKHFDSALLPTSLKRIDKGTLNLNYITTEIKIDPENKYFHSDSNLFLQNYPRKIIQCSYNSRRVTIRPTAISIGRNPFINCENIRFIHIPASLKSIGRCAFYGCL